MIGKKKRGLAVVLALAFGSIALLSGLNNKKSKSIATKTEISTGDESFTEAFKGSNKSNIKEKGIEKDIGFLIAEMIQIANEIQDLEKQLSSSKRLSKVPYNLSMDLSQIDSEEAEDIVIRFKEIDRRLVIAVRQEFNDFVRENSNIIRTLRNEQKLFHVPQANFASNYLTGVKKGIEELEKAKEKFQLFVNRLNSLESKTRKLIKDSYDAGFISVKLAEFLEKLNAMIDQLSERISICEILIDGLKERLMIFEALLSEFDIDGSYRKNMPGDVELGTRLLLNNDTALGNYFGEDPY